MNDKNQITFRKMTFNDLILDQISHTYESSFPENERRDFYLVRNLIANEPTFAAYALFHNDEYIGFITTWEFEQFSYIEHFAIETKARNGGFGAKTMQQYLKQSNAVVLEVEIPTNELAQRRIKFYERFGFVLCPQIYFQPPYRNNGEKVEMKIMSYGNINLENSFEEVCKTLYKKVYNQSVF